MKYRIVLLMLIIFALFVNACAGGGLSLKPPTEAAPSPTATLSGGYTTGGKIGNHASLFPIPTDVYNYMVLNENTLNFNTSLDFNEIIDFYREQFDKAGYTERTSDTEINDINFTVIWDGHDSGRAIVVQGLDLGNGSYNIIVKFEDL